VVVAMSGGVDSSVVAAMLAEEGYDVVGVTLQLYDHGAALAKKGACCAGLDIHDARRVAEDDVAFRTTCSITRTPSATP
jgi:tRNA-uridine 2-sulfurtransferase